MEKKVVFHIIDKLSMGGSTIHGVTQLLSWWFPHFDRARYQVGLVSLRERDKAGEYLEGLGIPVIYLGRNKYDPRTLIDLLKLLKKYGVQVIHLHGYGAATFGRLAGLIMGVPAIIHEHMYDAKIPLVQRVADRILRKSTTWSIAVSNSVKDFLVNQRSLPENNVQIIYSGAPLRSYNNEKLDQPLFEDRISWREELGIPASHRIVVIIGRLHPIKGHTYFLRAAREVIEECTQVTFLVTGDGVLMDELKQESRALGIAANVLFMGYCDNVPSLLKEVDIKVITSLSEGIPLTLFEAMAAGCPVVSTDVGGIKEILQDGKTGFLVPSRDVHAIASKIILLLTDEKLRKKMGQAACKAAQNYDVSSNVKQFEALYDRFAN